MTLLKILLCNIAIRNKPDPFPPVACTTLMNMLKRNGYDCFFYDIDVLRPSDDELTEFFRKNHFDIVGISAVVSTGYKYSKKLAGCIKRASPRTLIILGGNLAAAYETVLQKCDIDVCVIGEGERVLLNLVRHWEIYRNFAPNDDLSRIKGLAFREKGGGVLFTGYEKLIEACEIEEPDYAYLERYSNIRQYIFDPLTRRDFSCDPRAYESKRKNKKAATLFASKGCINSCSFCHRWVKGYRVIPVKQVISSIKYLMERYHVGFFCISDECFGEDSQWLEQFIEHVKPLDILFQIGGARVSLVKKNPTIMKRLKAIGLTAIYFGIESGSDKILKMMNKNTTRAENLQALKLCQNDGIFTVIQLVIGMPGENDQTIDETIEFIKDATESLPYSPQVAVNYLQILPGTPCYDFMRNRGLLGKTVEDEEKYLLGVSDVNASEFRQYVNVSESPLPQVRLWKLKIYLLPTIHWLKGHGWTFPARQNCEQNIGPAALHSAKQYLKDFLKKNILLYRLIDASGGVFWKLALVMNQYLFYGLIKASMILFGIQKEMDRSQFQFDAKGGLINGSQHYYTNI